MALDVLGTLLELAFPTRCSGCERPGTLLCDACLREVARIDPRHACGRCGAPLTDARQAAPGGAPRAHPHDGPRALASLAECPECWGRGFAFAEARAFGLLSAPLSRAVTLHKDGGERRLGPVLGALAGEHCAAEWAGWPDVVTFVPASRAAVARRGFDHAAAIAAGVATALGAPAVPLLTRLGRAQDQRRLGRAGRAANAAHSFAPRRERSGDPVSVAARVLLVDDVLTTGATLSACAETLLGAGAQEVRALAVARAVNAWDAPRGGALG